MWNDPVTESGHHIFKIINSQRMTQDMYNNNNNNMYNKAFIPVLWKKPDSVLIQ